MTQNRIKEAIRSLVGDYNVQRVGLWRHNRRRPAAEKIRLDSLEEGLYRLTVGSEVVHISRPSRWSRYRRGVSERTRRTAAVYGVPDKIQLREGDVVVDVGANVGEFSLACADAGAHVYAIEADASLIPALRKNCEGRTIDVFNTAVWCRNETLRFYSSTAQSDSSLIQPEDFEEMVSVDAVMLDHFITEHGIESIRLLKCDGEGAEPEILKGAIGRTLPLTRTVSLDCGPERRGESTLDDCVSILENVGFDVVIPGGTGHRVNLIGERRGA